MTFFMSLSGWRLIFCNRSTDRPDALFLRYIYDEGRSTFFIRYSIFSVLLNHLSSLFEFRNTTNSLFHLQPRF